MKKLLIAGSAALLLSATPALAAKSGSGDFTKDLEYGAGLGIVDMGLSNSGTMVYAIVEKPLEVKKLKGFDTVGQLRLGTSIGAASTGSIETTMDYMISGLFKAGKEVEKNISAYAMLGFSYASFTTTTPSVTVPFFGTIPGSSYTSTDSGLSWGIGADYEVDRDLTVGVEYANYMTNATAMAVNAKYNF